MAIALPDELQERGMQCLHGYAWPVGRIPENHRASGYALEACRTEIALSDELQEREQSVQSEDHEDHEDHVERVQPPPSAPEYKGTGV